MKYCKDCKYSGLFLLDDYCYKTTTEVTNKFTNTTKLILGIVPRSFRNCNGDCIHYERKWWKFWVKK